MLKVVSFGNLSLYAYYKMTTQRSLVLTLVKIFNWSDSQSSNHFQLLFYSLKNATLIHSKQIKVNFCENQAYFNYSIRVNYYPDESEMIIKLSHFSKISNSMKPIAQFTLNLDNLLTKKVQFLPFGKNDKVLKISAGEQKTPTLNNLNIHLGNSKFIKAKQQYLMNFSNRQLNSSLYDDYKNTKTVSQQAKQMLHSSKSVRQLRNDYKKGLSSQQKNYLKQQTDNKSNLVKQIQKKLYKSKSQRAFITAKGGRFEQLKNRKEQDYQQKSNKSQKHKLDLKSLEMVVCQNQYYEDSDFNGDRRDSLQRSMKTADKKKLIRSQLY